MRLVIKAKCNLRHDKLEPAIARGLNQGGDLVRTKVRRELKAITGVKAYKSITSRTERSGQGINRAAPGRLIYGVVARNKAIPIREFPVSVKKGRGGGVQAKSWGVSHLFKRSFVENGQYKARLGKERFPIRSLLGPNLAKELVKPRVVALFNAEVSQVVAPLVLKQIAKALA